MQLEPRSQDAGGQHVARLLKVLPPSVQEAARQIMEGQRAASLDPKQLRELSSSLMEILLQLMTASSPDRKGEQEGGQRSGGSGGAMPSGAPSSAPQGASEGKQAPGGADDGRQEGQQEGSEGQQSKGKDQQAPSLSDLLKELFGAESDDFGSTETAEGSEDRSAGDPNAPATPREIPLTPEEQERLDAEADLRAFLEVLERVIKGRAKRRGSGKSRWVAWSPGDVFVEPDEILRYREDDAYGVPPEQRRAIHRRDRKTHLVVVALDSSGSVSDILFALLHTGMAIVADMLAEVEDVHLGVCQFSGGAQWTLPPTDDLMEVDWFSKQPAKRLFNGGTTVSEVFKILGSEIAKYRSVDVVVMTDGYVEEGKELAQQVDDYSSKLGCEVKVHGVIFRGRGTTKKFEDAKALNPASIRVWHVGTEPPKPDPAAQAAKQKQALREITPAQRDELRRLRDAKRKEGGK